MNIDASMVKSLREATGAGIMECKRALQEANGDAAKAAILLKQAGLAKAEKKSGRSASQGVIEPYIHGGGRIGAIIEVNCETDFVARTPDFKDLAHNLAMQVAATNPRYLTLDGVSDADLAAIDKEFGDRKRATEAVSFLDQPYIKDGKLNIRDLIRASIAKLGENIVVTRFARFEVGADRPAEEAAGDE